jgi:hypothetical protein
MKRVFLSAANAPMVSLPIVVVLLGAYLLWQTDALAMPKVLHPEKKVTVVTRRNFLQGTSIVSTGVIFSVGRTPVAAQGDEAITSKQERISEEELKRIITSDVVERSFLVSADLTRDVYEEDATFTDEIDTYSISQWISGTKKLFVPEGSRVTLVGDVQVTPETVQFQFDEELMFRIPFRPVVSLSGNVILTRNPETGLISSYTEHWDQDVLSVLKTAKLKK